MSEEGFIAIARGILDHHIVGARKPFSYLEAWIWLLLEARWASGRIQVANGRVVNLERGQISHSLRYLATAWGWKTKRVRTFLRRLETGTQIGTQTGTGQMVITICNYNQYQNLSAAKGTAKGMLTGTQRAQRETKEPYKKDAADAAIESQEKQLFERGREVLGDDAGGLIAKLLKSKNRNIALARVAIETASTKSRPREYIGAVIAGGAPSGNGRRLTADEEFYGPDAIPGII
jgi:hypothetical protein